MNRVAVLVVVAVSAAAHAAVLKLEVVHRELPNLVYQLDCVSGAITSCSREAYEPLWQSRFLTSDEDRAALTTWREVRSRYAQSVELPQTSEFPLGWRGGRLSIDGSIRRAALLATSVDELASRLDLLMQPSDRDAATHVIKRFEPRFRAWYEAQAKSGDAFAAQLQKLLRRLDVLSLLSHFQRFYDADVSTERALPFLVLDRPESERPHSFAEQVDGVSLIEVTPSEKPNQRIDVVAHELCHYFYLMARPPTVAAMQDRFVHSKTPGAIGAFRLFDEAVATALGNGLMAAAANRDDFNRRLAKPQGFYADADIDRAAKALYPWLAAAVPANGSLANADFVDHYVELLAKEYGAELAAPRLAMFEVLLFADQRLSFDARAALHARFHVNSASSVVGLPEEPEVDAWYAAGHGTGVFVVPAAALGELAKKGLISATEEKSLREAKGGALLGKPRPNGEWLYVIVAPNQAALDHALDLLAAAKGPVEGLSGL